MQLMRVPRIRISLRCALLLMGIIAAYLAGAGSRRYEFARTLNHLSWARKELALEKEQSDLAMATAMQITIADEGDLDRIEELLDRLDAWDARSSDSPAAD